MNEDTECTDERTLILCIPLMKMEKKLKWFQKFGQVVSSFCKQKINRYGENYGAASYVYRAAC